jgi:hypothetical protein
LDDIEALRREFDAHREGAGSDMAEVATAIAALEVGFTRLLAAIEQIGLQLNAVADQRPPAVRRGDAPATPPPAGGETPEPTGEPGADAKDGPQFDDMAEWVEEWLLPNLERRMGNTRRWCNRWYRHPEVVMRLHVVWSTWEHAYRLDDPTTLSSWYIDHLDKHLAVIFSADGPFAGCSPQRHSPRVRLDRRTRPAVEPEILGYRYPDDGDDNGDNHRRAHGEFVDPQDDFDDYDEDRTQEVRTS